MRSGLAHIQKPESTPETIAEFKDRARALLPVELFAYIERAAGEGETHRRNLSSYSKFDLVPRVLTGAEIPGTDRVIGGMLHSAPIIIAPTAWHGLVHPDGECATFEAARESGITMAISSFSTRDFSEIASRSKSRRIEGAWYQLMLHRDLSVLSEAIGRAESHGCSALLLTVDAPAGCSMCRGKSGTSVGLPPSKLPLLPRSKSDQSSSIEEYYRINLSPVVSTWEYVSRICASTRLPVFLKGIVHPADVQLAARAGAKGVVISNHGGRQMDNGISTLAALASIMRAPDGVPEIEILLDGGIRSGADIFKAIALGARGVLVGRPILYGLAVGGASGVSRILSILRRELADCMVQCGVGDLESISRAFLSARAEF